MAEETNKTGGVETLDSGNGKRFLGEEGLTELISLVKNSTYSSGGGTTSGHTGTCEGGYVAYVDYDRVKRIIDPESWSDDLGAPQGIMVGDGKHEVMLTPEIYTVNMMQWTSQKNYDTLVNGMITVDHEVNDYNGRLNTEAIINMGGDYASADYIPGYCHNYAYGCTGAGEWWLPSYGEVSIINNFIDRVNKALGTFGVHVEIDVEKNGAPTSTQCGTSSYWNFAKGAKPKYDTSAKEFTYLLIPVTSWDYVED